MDTLTTIDAMSKKANELRADLAAVLESICRLEEHDKAILQAQYLIVIGDLEYRLMSIQVESSALQWRIENIQACLNRGETVTAEALIQAENFITSQMSAWQNSLLEKETAISGAHQMMIEMIIVSSETVQQVKTTYRRLARLLHPDVSPQNQEIFDRYWNSIQQAYLAMDAALLDALLHIVEHETEATRDNITQAEVDRLQSALLQQTQRLAQIQNSVPYCYAELLNDESWVAAKRSDLIATIEQAAARHAQLLSRYAATKSKVMEK